MSHLFVIRRSIVRMNSLRCYFLEQELSYTIQEVRDQTLQKRNLFAFLDQIIINMILSLQVMRIYGKRGAGLRFEVFMITEYFDRSFGLLHSRCLY